jgi:YHS domain-containing protein|tara:strand:+ start:6 stop:350 length:345 start_codon:yes stop_codon:yes gene_type:complete
MRRVSHSWVNTSEKNENDKTRSIRVLIKFMQSLDYWNDKDRRKITSSYVGVTYQFFSIKNEREFDNSPEKYASKYGGYCSIAISEGSLVEANPNSALIQIDELHVFYKDEDTQD